MILLLQAGLMACSWIYWHELPHLSLSRRCSLHLQTQSTIFAINPQWHWNIPCLTRFNVLHLGHTVPTPSLKANIAISENLIRHNEDHHQHPLEYEMLLPQTFTHLVFTNHGL